MGQLNSELFRARRLVVDTGLHAKRWTRQQGIDYGIEASEVERYAVFPGQACSYMMGELKIIENREKAKKALGEKFSLRQFHNKVLATGMVPLELLDLLRTLTAEVRSLRNIVSRVGWNQLAAAEARARDTSVGMTAKAERPHGEDQGMTLDTARPAGALAAENRVSSHADAELSAASGAASMPPDNPRFARARELLAQGLTMGDIQLVLARPPLSAAELAWLIDA